MYESRSKSKHISSLKQLITINFIKLKHAFAFSLLFLKSKQTQNAAEGPQVFSRFARQQELISATTTYIFRIHVYIFFFLLTRSLLHHLIIRGVFNIRVFCCCFLLLFHLLISVLFWPFSFLNFVFFSSKCTSSIVFVFNLFHLFNNKCAIHLTRFFLLSLSLSTFFMYDSI